MKFVADYADVLFKQTVHGMSCDWCVYNIHWQCDMIKSRRL